MEPIGEILEHVCPCGGDRSAPLHGESLLHREWMLGRGLSNEHDPLDTLALIRQRDIRRISEFVPPREHHDLG